ncbi:hypothetical protein BH23GEM6_BH23GEM6_06890 [soil metagenome]
MLYIIDRMEEGWAILEDPEGLSFQLPRSWLPSRVREGDVLRISIEPGSEPGVHSTLQIEIDAEEGAKRAEQIRLLRERLTRGPSGDLAL